MSQKFGNYCRGLGILAMLAFSLAMSACDPCRNMAELACKCLPTQPEIKACLADLNTARQHEKFDVASEPEICLQALKNCTCEDINNNNDKKCGVYRFKK